MQFGISELAAALVGVILAGGLESYRVWQQSRRESKTLLNAIRAEVIFVTDFIRSQKYHIDLRNAVSDSDDEDWDGGLFMLYTSDGYLEIFDNLISEIGKLSPEHVSTTVEFYKRAKVFLDAAKPSKEYVEQASLQERRSHTEESYKNVIKLLELGDEIRQYTA